MYENIGKKIKLLAKLLFGILSAIGVIGGIVIISIDEDIAFIGAILIFLLPLVAWISSWFLYGFGEIIDKLTDIENNTRNVSANSKRKSQAEINNEEKIKKLENLLVQGLITKEEYDESISKI